MADKKNRTLVYCGYKFNEELADEKVLLFNETYTPLFENKLAKPYERSGLHLHPVLQRNRKGLLNTFKFNQKTHSTMKQKIFLPLYAEHLHFLKKRAGWVVTKIYAHYTFHQSKLKKNTIMNQVSRENAKRSVEEGFYKLMNNANFGYDCRNNINN